MVIQFVADSKDALKSNPLNINVYAARETMLAFSCSLSGDDKLVLECSGLLFKLVCKAQTVFSQWIKSMQNHWCGLLEFLHFQYKHTLFSALNTNIRAQ